MMEIFVNLSEKIAGHVHDYISRRKQGYAEKTFKFVEAVPSIRVSISQPIHLNLT